jgi:hypothetical protein
MASQPSQAESPDEEKLTESDLVRIEAQGNTNAFSRAIAVMVLMCLPGFGGHLLDQWLGTRYFILIGFVFGMVVAIWGLLYVSSIADATAKQNRERKKRIELEKQKQE